MSQLMYSFTYNRYKLSLEMKQQCSLCFALLQLLQLVPFDKKFYSLFLPSLLEDYRHSTGRTMTCTIGAKLHVLYVPIGRTSVGLRWVETVHTTFTSNFSSQTSFRDLINRLLHAAEFMVRVKTTVMNFLRDGNPHP